jgi:hypothetical protein
LAETSCQRCGAEGVELAPGPDGNGRYCSKCRPIRLSNLSDPEVALILIALDRIGDRAAFEYCVEQSGPYSPRVWMLFHRHRALGPDASTEARRDYAASLERLAADGASCGTLMEAAELLREAVAVRTALVVQAPGEESADALANAAARLEAVLGGRARE